MKPTRPKPAPNSSTSKGLWQALRSGIGSPSQGFQLVRLKGFRLCKNLKGAAQVGLQICISVPSLRSFALEKPNVAQALSADCFPHTLLHGFKYLLQAKQRLWKKTPNVCPEPAEAPKRTWKQLGKRAGKDYPGIPYVCACSKQGINDSC